MYFPNVEDIATTEVVTISDQRPVREALELMLARELRDIVIVGGNDYGILTVDHLIRLRERDPDLDAPIADAGFRRLPRVQRGENILDILRYFSPRDDYLCVVDGDGLLVGIVSYTDIVACIDPQVMIERQQLGELLTRHHIKRAEMDTPMSEVFVRLTEVSDAVVVTADERPAGIITTKDAVRLLSRDIPATTTAAECMSAPLETVGPDMTIKEAIDYLRERQFKRVIVQAPGGELLGMITQKELVSIAYSKWSELMREHAAELRELVGLLERKTERLEQLAETDRLTGIYNRAKMEQVLEREVERFNHYGQGGFSLVLLDVDHFKRINDDFGHLIGDEVLKQLAAIVSAFIREQDVFARWGGEEFILLLPHTDLYGAQHFAERLRSQIAESRVRGPGTVTVSLGVACCRAGEDIDTLLHRTDEALYAAKDSGRNRVAAAA